MGCYRRGTDIGCTPGSLKIETACNGIDIQYLAGKKKAGMLFAFQRIQVYVAQIYTTGGNKFFPELAFTT